MAVPAMAWAGRPCYEILTTVRFSNDAVLEFQAEMRRAPDRSAGGFGGETLHGLDVAAEVAHDIDGVRVQRLDLKVGRALGGVFDPHAHVAEQQLAELSLVDPLFRQV